MKTLDQTQKASEERLLTHDIVIHSYLWNVLCMFFIRIKNNCFSKTYSEIESKWYKSIQARKKLVCRVAVKNCLCNILYKFFIKIESTRRCEIKKQTPQLTLLYCGRPVRSSNQKCSTKKAFLKKFTIFTEKDLCWGISLIKLRAFKFFKKRLQHRHFL